MHSMPPLALYYLCHLQKILIEVDIVDPSIISKSQSYEIQIPNLKNLLEIYLTIKYDILFYFLLQRGGVICKE